MNLNQQHPEHDKNNEAGKVYAVSTYPNSIVHVPQTLLTQEARSIRSPEPMDWDNSMKKNFQKGNMNLNQQHPEHDKNNEAGKVYAVSTYPNSIVHVLQTLLTQEARSIRSPEPMDWDNSMKTNFQKGQQTNEQQPTHNNEGKVDNAAPFQNPVDQPSSPSNCQFVKLGATININFEEGKVVSGDKSSIRNLLPHLESLKPGTGVVEPGLVGRQFKCSELGMGAIGKVYKVEMAKRRCFVGKQVKKEFFDENEVHHLLAMSHESIPTIMGLIKWENIFEIFMEYSGITLEQFVKVRREKQFTEGPLIWSVAKQFLSALAYLATQGIMHMDLHPGNICIDMQGKIQIIDFGSAQKAGEVKDITYIGLTNEYIAPEVCCLKMRLEDKRMQFPLTGKCDVFACGLCLQFLLDKQHTLRTHFSRFQDERLAMKRMVDEPNMVVEEFITRNGSPEMMCLLKSLLPGYPCNRLSAEEGLSKMADLQRNPYTTYENKKLVVAETNSF